MNELIDLVCMVYHEARNVRFPIKRDRVSDAHRFKALTALSRSRPEAWRQMHKLRRAARSGKEPDGIARVFHNAYGLTVSDIAELNARPIWRGSATGGNAWGAIAHAVAEALELHERDETDACIVATASILVMSHNTGVVSEKLRALREAEGAASET